MIREKAKYPSQPIIIDLAGPEGNAFVLMGYAKDWGKQIGYSESDIKSMIDDMKSSDYVHLLEVLDSHFGEFIILER